LLSDSAYAFSLSVSATTPLSPLFLGTVFLDKIQLDDMAVDYAVNHDARARIQFCASMPVLSSALLDDDRLMHLVDHRMPVSGRSAVHKLGKIPVDVVTQACHLIRDMNEGRRCIGASGLISYVGNMEPSFASRVPQSSPADLKNLMGLALHAPWTAKQLKPIATKTGIGIPDISKKAVWDHFPDMVHDLWECLLYSNSENYSTTMAKALLQTVNPVNLYTALARHMDGGIPNLYVDNNKRDETYWATPTSDMTIPNGFTIRFLSSSLELDHESAIMHHCVESYDDYCMANRCHIGSIGKWETRDDELIWTPSSTFELRAPMNLLEKTVDSSLDSKNRKKYPRPYLVQHMGPGNNRPPQECVDKLDVFLREIEMGNIEYDFSILNSPKRIAHQDDLVAKLGDNWNTPVEHLRRWNLWKRFLNLKPKTLDAWIDHQEPHFRAKHKPHANEEPLVYFNP
jgi:hypothetical protein